MEEQIFFILAVLMLFILFTVVSKRSTYKKHPPRVEFAEEGSRVAEVYFYRYYGRSGAGEYQKYVFVRNEKNKWKLSCEDKKKVIRNHLIVSGIVILLSLFFTEYFPVLYLLLFDVAFAMIVAIICYLLVLTPYIFLKIFLRKKKEDSEMPKEYKYVTIEKNIKNITKAVVFLFWLGILCLLTIPYVILGIDLYSLLSGGPFRTEFVFVGIAVLGFSMLSYGWICLRKHLMGDRSFYIPINIAEKREKYSPEKALRRLRDNRNNVILLKNMQGWIRIYGAGETHILEVRIEKKEGAEVFNMIVRDTDSIMPVADDTPCVAENGWYERFPTRTRRIVEEETICAFLEKLYTCKDIQRALEGFSFEDTTEEIHKLIEADAYIVPEVPVDWPVGGIKSNMGAEWMRKKEDRVQRALEELSHVNVE